MTGMYRVSLVIAVWAALSTLGVAAAQEGIRVVQADGQATILQGDVSAARDLAIIAARVKAIELAFGMVVSAETVLNQERIVDHTVLNQTKGFIRAYRVLSEHRQPGIYHVTIEAWVTDELTDEQAQALFRNYSVVVGLSTLIDGASTGDERLEDALIGRLVDNEYDVLDKRQMSVVQGDSIVQQALRGNAQAARQMGERFLANVVVAGTAEARFSSVQDVPGGDFFGNPARIVFYRGHLSLRAYATDSGGILCQVNSPFEGIRGSGVDSTRAAEAALAQLPPFVDNMIEGLSQYRTDKRRTVTVQVQGMPDLPAFHQVKRLLEQQRWVENVQAREFVLGQASRFTLTYPEKTYILAASLNRWTFLQVEEQSWNRVVLNYLAEP